MSLTEIKVPDFGWSKKFPGKPYLLIIQWDVAVGDSVSRGDVLFSAEDTKTTVDVEAPEDGVVVEILEPKKTYPDGLYRANENEVIGYLKRNSPT